MAVRWRTQSNIRLVVSYLATIRAIARRTFSKALAGASTRLFMTAPTLLCTIVVILIFAFVDVAQARNCRSLFQSSIHSLSQADVQRRQRELYEMVTLLRVDVASGEAVRPAFVRHSIEIAKQLFDSQGVQYREIELDGFTALEVVPQSDAAPGWNKMAASMDRNYQSNLVFSPAELALTNSEGGFASWSNHRHTIFISTDSFGRGRGEYTVLHEARHLAIRRRAAQSPTPISGTIELSAESTLSRIHPQDDANPEFMVYEELATGAQDLLRAAIDAANAGGTAGARDLVARAERAKLVSLVGGVGVQFARDNLGAIRSAAMIAGPVMGENGPSELVYVQFGSSVRVYVDRTESGILKLELKGQDLNLLMELKENGDWRPMIERLRSNDARALAAVRPQIDHIVSTWISNIEPANRALQVAGETVINANPSTPARHLLEQARRPWSAVSRLLPPPLEETRARAPGR